MRFSNAFSQTARPFCYIPACESQITTALSLAVPFSLFLLVKRTSRNVLEVLSRLGLSISYRPMHLAQRTVANEGMERGTLVAKGPCSIGWDNIQYSTSIFVEQWFLCPPKVQSGTTSVVYGLRNASHDDCRLIPLLQLSKSLRYLFLQGHTSIKRTQDHHNAGCC